MTNRETATFIPMIGEAIPLYYSQVKNKKNQENDTDFLFMLIVFGVFALLSPLFDLKDKKKSLKERLFIQPKRFKR